MMLSSITGHEVSDMIGYHPRQYFLKNKLKILLPLSTSVIAYQICLRLSVCKQVFDTSPLLTELIHRYRFDLQNSSQLGTLIEKLFTRVQTSQML